MTPKNSEFVTQLAKNLQAALDDLATSTASEPKYDLL